MLKLRKTLRTKLPALKSLFNRETPTASLLEKIQVIVFPSLLIMAIGILEIHYPDALANFNYGGDLGGIVGLILLLFELFLMLTWGKIEGYLLILLGISIIVMGFWPEKKREPETVVAENLKNSATTLLTEAAFRTGKAYFQRKRRNQKSESNS